MAASSIKTLLPKLESVFRMDAGLIYERQRALVRAGLLKPREGRGPGSGVAATPRSVSLLLLAVMASDNPAAGAERAAQFAKLAPTTPISRGVCRITGKRSLLDAVTLLVGENRAGLYAELTISRDQLFAELSTHDVSGNVSELFYSRGHQPQQLPAIRIKATFCLLDLWAIFHSEERS